MPLHPFTTLLILFLGLMGCSASRPTPTAPDAAPLRMPRINLSEPTPPPPNTRGVLLGIDVLQQQGFSILKGKRVGLLTHAAGVNRNGESTIEVLRKAPGVKLSALFAVEHGLRGELPAEQTYPDQRDPRTGLMVYSLYNGKSRWASPAQLAGIDALVIDLQDIGTRSYTYISAMRYALEACFKAGKEVVVLDRPNPLGGLKVDGPPLDAEWTSYVGAFHVPYVHGLTIGELARMAKEAPGVLRLPTTTKPLPDELRAQGKLTVIPMKGWRRSMRWPDTGLSWIPTSPMIRDYAAVMGYPMSGLGCYLGGFRHGVGEQYPFRGLSHKTVSSEVVERELRACNIPGLRFRKVSVQVPGGKPATGIFIEVADWEEWRPTELSFHLMRLACKLEKNNPFLSTPQGTVNGFLRHMGSTAFLEALRKEGSHIDVESWIRDWQSRSRVYQQQVRRYWLYE